MELYTAMMLYARADDFVAVHESGCGTKRKSRHVRTTVAMGWKAENMCSG